MVISAAASVCKTTIQYEVMYYDKFNLIFDSLRKVCKLKDYWLPK